MMQVFITWSRPSGQRVAEAVRKGLLLFKPPLEPWVSAGGVEAGADWRATLLREIRNSEFNIICLTKASLNSPWPMFEAGAIAGLGRDEGRVFPLLLGIAARDVPEPLQAYQHQTLDEAGWRSLVARLLTLAKADGSADLPKMDLQKRIARSWTLLDRENLWNGLEFDLQSNHHLVEGHWFDVYSGNDGERISVLCIETANGRLSVVGTEFDADLKEALRWESSEASANGNAHLFYPFRSRSLLNPNVFLGRTDLEFAGIVTEGGKARYSRYAGEFTNTYNDGTEFRGRLEGRRVPIKIGRRHGNDVRDIAAWVQRSRTTNKT